ncbi:hypothetical protein ACK1CN_19830 [Vibrio coralliilyticus]|uniref:hypothetical protein n=1 Tax=Vibrio coralliilyticus TaxID=190893 RepID=UPI003916E25B
MKKTNVLMIIGVILVLTYIPVVNGVTNYFINSSTYSHYYDEVIKKTSLTDEEMKDWEEKEKYYIENEVDGVESSVFLYSNLLFFMYLILFILIIKSLYNMEEFVASILLAFSGIFILFVY